MSKSYDALLRGVSVASGDVNIQWEYIEDFLIDGLRGSSLRLYEAYVIQGMAIRLLSALYDRSPRSITPLHVAACYNYFITSCYFGDEAEVGWSKSLHPLLFNAAETSFGMRGQLVDLVELCMDLNRETDACAWERTLSAISGLRDRANRGLLTVGVVEELLPVSYPFDAFSPEKAIVDHAEPSFPEIGPEFWEFFDRLQLLL